MSKGSHEIYLAEKAAAANTKAVLTAKLQDAFLEQIQEDVNNKDYTALDELLYKILTIPGASTLLIAYLSEGKQEEFAELIEPEL